VWGALHFRLAVRLIESPNLAATRSRCDCDSGNLEARQAHFPFAFSPIHTRLVDMPSAPARYFTPYKSLAVLLVPLLIVEPVKMAGVAFVGLGHGVGGACMIIGAYAVGLLFVDRLFRVVKSRIYTLPWCATIARQIQMKLALLRWWSIHLRPILSWFLRSKL
jgi:hypothetical protein